MRINEDWQTILTCVGGVAVILVSIAAVAFVIAWWAGCLA